MSEKRKDNKGRVLREGESQRSDGRYMYRYTDPSGVRRTVYSWRLVGTDKIPDGKRSTEPLRDQIKKIQKDQEDGIKASEASKYSLNAYFDEYMRCKIGIRDTTKAFYTYLYKIYVRNRLGVKKISLIKYSDVKKFYTQLIMEEGLKPKSVGVINAVIGQVFNFAVRDGIIRYNPTVDAMKEIKRSDEHKGENRHALTIQQQERFMSFISSTEPYLKWVPLFTVMLGTGARISEIAGLQWSDCDMEHGLIHISRSMPYKLQENGKVEPHISTPKTSAGVRVIPMLQSVKSALLSMQRAKDEAGIRQCNCSIDGYSDFVFVGSKGTPLLGNTVNSWLQRIVDQYNELETICASNEQRKPVLLPHISAHTFRHTFCTRLYESGMDTKIIQEVMGHSTVRVTMDIYAHVTQERKMEAFENFENNRNIFENTSGKIQ